MNVRSFVTRTRLNVSDGLNAGKSSVVANEKNRITLTRLCACGTFVYSFPSVLSREWKTQILHLSFRFAANNVPVHVDSNIAQRRRQGQTNICHFVRGDTSLRTACIVTSSHGLVFVCGAHLVHTFDIYSQQTFHSCWARISLFRNVNRLSLSQYAFGSFEKWRNGEDVAEKNALHYSQLMTDSASRVVWTGDIFQFWVILWFWIGAQTLCLLNISEVLIYSCVKWTELIWICVS